MLKVLIGAEFTKVPTAKGATTPSSSQKRGAVRGAGAHVSNFRSPI